MEVEEVVERVKDKRHKKRVKVNSEQEKQCADKQYSTQNAGQLYLVRSLEGFNMLVVAVDEEHAQSLCWEVMSDKSQLNISVISLFEPSARFVQIPQKCITLPEQKRVSPYAVFHCAKHIMYPDTPAGTIVVADNINDALALITQFFENHNIWDEDEFGNRFSLTELNLTKYHVYV